MNSQQKAIDYFRKHFNCAQSVFTVFGTESGLTEDQCLKIACGFGAGMGRQQYTCGALTGAIMAVGLKHGKATGDPEEKKTNMYALTRELFTEFRKLNGSTCCRELLEGLDINDLEDHRKIVELRLFEIKCEKYVRDAVVLAEIFMSR